ncbi:MAG TPA: hypothetical protein VFU48_12730 [Nitrospira sp.]|nr:hypothetical protein [Nitrospira sp.]
MTAQNNKRHSGSRSLADFMRGLQEALLHMPAIIGIVVVSLAIAILGYGLLQVVLIAVHAIPQYKPLIEKLSLPIILIGAAALLVGGLVIIIVVTRSAGRASDDEMSEKSTLRVPGAAVFEVRSIPAPLPPGSVVEGSVDESSMSTDSISTYPLRLNSVKVWLVVGTCGLTTIFVFAQTVTGGITLESVVEAIPVGLAVSLLVFVALFLFSRVKRGRH